MHLAVHNISKTFRDNDQAIPALADINFSADAGAFITLIGPSGCGKSTLFNIIVGLTEPDTGEICLNGQALQQRTGRFGYMPQRDLLLPWRSVLNNVILGPELAGENLKAARQEATSLLPLFGLEGFGDAYPATLSGGMRQRAALLRTFLMKRDIMLFDEPFGALDALTRRALQVWLLAIWERSQKTILFITHDVEEALFLSDRILVISPRPGSIALNLEVDLPRPRSTDIFVESHFVELKAQLLTALES
ncbi:MAG: ABC transporter ATP-binding protein [Anaerolineae bacterium]|nr:ABC transporter ATP-binding protein [Anaerolineae bacterium]